MITYKNTRNKPICIDTADGNALSVPSKGKFKVDKNTSLMPLFKSYISKGIFKKIGEDKPEPVVKVVANPAKVAKFKKIIDTVAKPEIKYPGHVGPVYKTSDVYSVDTKEDKGSDDSVKFESKSKKKKSKKAKE